MAELPTFKKINPRWVTFRIWSEYDFDYTECVIQLLPEDTDEKVYSYREPPFIYVSEIRRT